MMQGTQGDAVSDDWLSGGIRVGDDVGRIKEFFVAKAAECALTSICLKHAFPKGSLVESHTDHGGDVRSTGAVGVLVEPVVSPCWAEAHVLRIIHRD